MSENPWRAPGREDAPGVGAPDPTTYPPAGPPASADPYAPAGPPANPYPSPGPYPTAGAPAGPPSGPYPPSGVPAGPPAGAHPPSGPYPAPGPYDAPFATSDRHRAHVFAGAGYQTPAYRNDRVAVTAMVLGIVGIVVPGVCLLAIALGHLALHRLKTAYEGGRGLAVAGLAMGYGMSAIWLAVLLLVLVARSTF